MGFKEDEDFARFLTMGAHAAAAISHDLEQAHGHRIVELERYARANKIWAIKVKRMRLPDLLCINCGRRFEAKGKSKLELRLSDSAAAGREWWAGGMREDDVFAFVRVLVDGDDASVGQVVYTTLAALQASQDALISGQRKAVSAGSEVAVSWPAWTPSADGVVESASAEEIVICKKDGRTQRYRNHAKWPRWYLYRHSGESFGAGDIVVGSVAPASVDCHGDEWDWFSDLSSDNEGDRFVAVKAARWRNSGEADNRLRELALDESEDWRTALEAAASLSVRDEAMIPTVLTHVRPEARDGEAMEAVFVLTELPLPESGKALQDVAENPLLPSEVRAAAVWGLGLGEAGEVERLAPFVAHSDDLIALHAGAALPDALPEGVRGLLGGWLDSGTVREATAAAHVLARRREAPLLLEKAKGVDPQIRALILRALGDRPRAEVEPHLGHADGDATATLRTLWVQEQDWLRGPLTDGGLEVLERQRLRL